MDIIVRIIALFKIEVALGNFIVVTIKDQFDIEVSVK